MAEKREFLASLDRTGLRPEYDARLQELRAQGMSQATAYRTLKPEFEQRLEAVVAGTAFCGTDADRRPPDRGEKVSAEPQRAERPNLSRDVEWVYNHADLDGPTLDAAYRLAPSIGARGLLRWVKTSPENWDSFYRNVAPKVLMNQKRLDAEADKGQETKKLDDLIERTLRAALKEAGAGDDQDERRPDAGDVPEAGEASPGPEA